MRTPPTPAEYAELAEPRHRFGPVSYQGEVWNLAHLDSFVMNIELRPGFAVDVLVYFSCHCFTRSYEEHEHDTVPKSEHYPDGHAGRLLDRRRYGLSRRFLPRMVRELASRSIMGLGGTRPNYCTVEVLDDEGRVVPYTVFFEVVRSTTRKRRVVLFVQSAYVKEVWSCRERVDARKVRFATLVRRAYEGAKL